MGKDVRRTAACCPIFWLAICFYTLVFYNFPGWVARYGLGTTAILTVSVAYLVMGVMPAFIFFYALGIFPDRMYPWKRKSVKQEDEIPCSHSLSREDSTARRGSKSAEFSQAEKELLGVINAIRDQRRLIDQSFRRLYGFNLFQEQDKVLDHLPRSCSSEEEFNTCITYLASLVTALNEDGLKNHISGSFRLGPLDTLQAFLKERFAVSGTEIVRAFRQVLILQDPFNREPQFLLQTLHDMELDFPPDWTLLWKRSLDLYLKTLSSLRKLSQSQERTDFMNDQKASMP